MKQYRKKPIVIESIQFTGGSQIAIEIIRWIHSFEVQKATYHHDDDAMMIHSLEGWMRADPGDWIIKGIKGEFYPCKPVIFDATYEPVEDK